MKNLKITERLQSHPPLFLATGFLFLIAVGTILLMMPFASADGSATPFIDSLFTATSSVCVTGLTTVNTATHWSGAGHVVILVLIQIGGLGFMTAASILALILGKRFTLPDRLIISEQMGTDELQGTVDLMRYAIASTFVIEGIGAVLLMFSFVPEYGVKGIWYSVFHAISAFCNAGFDLFGDSMVRYGNRPGVLLVISLLIILGGLGFGVYADVMKNKTDTGRYALHTKIVLVTTGILLVAGFLITLILESGNPETLYGAPLSEKINQAFFQSVTLRTAGFQAMPQDKILDATAAFSIPMMFIGGSPAATAGGVKTTTFAMLFIVLASEIRGREEITAFERRIRPEILRRAISILVLAMIWVSFTSIVLYLLEPYGFIDLLYETVSAFGTVGLTRNLTPYLTDASKYLLIISMYLGRVGAMTVIFAFSKRKTDTPIKQAHGEVIIG